MNSFILSQRGGEKLDTGGYLYIFDKTSVDGVTQFWRCERKTKCRARVHILNGRIMKTLNFHTHAASKSKSKADKVVTKLKSRATETVEVPSKAINDCGDSLLDEYIPTHEAVRKLDRREGNSIQCVPTNTIKLETTIISDDEVCDELSCDDSSMPTTSVTESHIPQESTVRMDSENSCYSPAYDRAESPKKTAVSTEEDELDDFGNSMVAQMREQNKNTEDPSHDNACDSYFKQELDCDDRSHFPEDSPMLKENDFPPCVCSRSESLKRNQTLTQEDELDIFGKSIAAQMRKLPEEYAVEIMSEIQSLLANKRLKFIANKRQI